MEFQKDGLSIVKDLYKDKEKREADMGVLVNEIYSTNMKENNSSSKFIYSATDTTIKHCKNEKLNRCRTGYQRNKVYRASRH